MAETETIPPLPYKIPVLTPNGLLSDPWAKWFRQIFTRVGGSVAPSNSELADGQTAQLANVLSHVTELESLLATHTITINSNVARIIALEAETSGLNQGPNL